MKLIKDGGGCDGGGPVLEPIPSSEVWHVCVDGWRFKPSSIQLITFVGKKACGGISRRFVDKLFSLAIIAN